MSVMADVFFGSARTSSRLTRWPRNFSYVFPNSHLLGFKVTLAAWNLCRASVRRLLCYSVSLP